MGAVAEAVLERLQDEVALDVRDGAADQRARHLLGDQRGMGDRRRLRLVEPHAVGREDGVGADLIAARQQHGAVNGVLELTHIAGPAADHELVLGLSLQRAHRHAVRLRVFLGEMLGELGDVGGALAQRRDLQVHHVEAEQEVLA